MEILPRERSAAARKPTPNHVSITQHAAEMAASGGYHYTPPPRALGKAEQQVKWHSRDEMLRSVMSNRSCIQHTVHSKVGMPSMLKLLQTACAGCLSTALPRWRRAVEQGRNVVLW